MVFKRARLPSDNFPDDFDNRAYRIYKPGSWLMLLGAFSRVFFLAGAVALTGVSFVVSLSVLSVSDAPRTAEFIPTHTPQGDVQGDFPQDVIQQSITLPARIDSALAFGEKKGYRFFARPGLTWVITVTPDNNLDPLLTLYNPDGTVVQLNDDLSGNSLASQIIFQPPANAQYAILIESAAGGTTAGGYTLTIMPQR